MQVQIESTSICDAECVFCIYPTMQRQRGTMSMELFRKIIDDAATIPQVDKLTITGLGETLLDKHLFERLAYARPRLPKAEIDFFTNGSRLTDENIKKISESGVNTVYVSLNAVTRLQRKQVMNLDDFDWVTEQIPKLGRAMHDKGRVVVKAVASKDLMEIGDTDEFQTRWGGPMEMGGGAMLHLEGNWAGELFKMRTTPQKACHRALGQFMILWDGRVSMCCFDGEGKEIFGDMRTQSIREVYNGEKALGVREAHAGGRRAEIPMCAACTAIAASFAMFGMGILQAVSGFATYLA